MRVLPAAALAVLLASGVPAGAQSQLGGVQDNNAIAVPPAPAIVASPISPPMPPAPATPAPPGLVPASPPPDTLGDNGDSDDGSTGTTAPATPGQPATSAAGPNAAAPNAAPGAADTAQNQDQDTIPTPPNTWQPGTIAKIGVLDKIDGEVKEISVPVGGQSVVGDLQVNVVACFIRPPDQAPDAAVFLALQNTGNLSGPPDYRGWLIRSEPGAAVAGDASEIFRVIDCS